MEIKDGEVKAWIDGVKQCSLAYSYEIFNRLIGIYNVAVRLISLLPAR